MDLNPAEFEAHYGREGLNPTKVNTSSFLYKKPENSKKQAENKQKSAGG